MLGPILIALMLLVPFGPLLLFTHGKPAKPAASLPATELPPLPRLPLEVTADRLLAAIWGLPSLAGGLLAAAMIALDFRGFIAHPLLALAVLFSGALAGWAGWVFGHNLIWPDRLSLTQDGVVVSRLGRRRVWRWDEIADARAGYRGKLLSDLVIILKQDDPARVRWARWGILQNARTIPLGKMWKSPFGTRASAVISGLIRAVLAARQHQPMTAQLSG